MRTALPSVELNSADADRPNSSPLPHHRFGEGILDALRRVSYYDAETDKPLPNSGERFRSRAAGPRRRESGEAIKSRIPL
jgi:hypothetical protein